MSPPGGRPRRFGPRRDDGPRRVGESLEDALARLADAGPAQLSAVFDGWEEIAGPLLSRHVRPLRVSGGVLVVAADHPAWATEVRRLSSSLLARVGERCGETPDRLEVTVRRGGTGSSRGSRNAPDPPPVG